MVDIVSTHSLAGSIKPAADLGSASTIEEPMDLVLLSLKEKVYVKCRQGRELKGKLVVSIYTYA